MLRFPTITKRIEDILKEKTQLPVETCGYLIFMKGEFTPDGYDEAIIPVETNLGTATSVDTNPIMDIIISYILKEKPSLGAIEFHVHPECLGEQWYNSLSQHADIPILLKTLDQNPDYVHLFISPNFYAFIGADPTSSTGIGGYQLSWGNAPERTPFDKYYNRTELGERIIQIINKALHIIDTYNN